MNTFLTRNLMYTAMTRAIDNIYLVSNAMKSVEESIGRLPETRRENLGVRIRDKMSINVVDIPNIQDIEEYSIEYPL